MIHLTDKIRNRQHGITLMLSIMILAAITAIAFSLATIVFIEIRSAGDVLRTEPALYATQGVTEEALFKYKRYVQDNLLSVVGCSPSWFNICNLNSVSLSSPSPTARVFDTSPRIDTIFPSSTNQYLFIDPAAPNSFVQAYSHIGVSYFNNGFNGQLEVIINKYDSTGLKTNITDTTLLPGGYTSYNPLSGDGQYELVLKNLSSGGSIIASLEGTDVIATNANHNTIPLVGRQVLDITASYLGITRKYTVNIPLP